MNDKLFEALDEYNAKFGDGFPMYQMSGEPPEKIIEIIKDCIEQEKDVYTLGYLSEDDNLLY